MPLTSGSITARHYMTGALVQLDWKEGLIALIQSPPNPSAAAAAHRWIAPALLDLQINGYAGVDFQRDDLEVSDLLRAAAGLQADGCGRWYFTLITDTWPKLLARLSRARALQSGSAVLRHAIAGWHIEGPFLSDVPGYAGAHNPRSMCDPSPIQIGELRQAAGSDPVLLTLAPERPGAMETIQAAVQAGIKVSLGHTNASADQLRQAIDAGATGFTHLGNGCPKELDRQDNILCRVLDTRGLFVSLIVDGIHVSAPFFRLVHRVLEPARIYYTTDAMAAAGSPPGRYRLGAMELEVGPDQIVRKPGSPLFAGSALRPIDGIRQAARMRGQSWQEVWSCFSTHAAAMAGVDQDLRVGLPASFCLIDTSPDNQILAVQTVSPCP